MTDLAVSPLSTGALDDEPSEFTRSMRAAVAQQTRAYQEHQELKRLYALALAEIEQLRGQVARYQRGEGITVEISGRQFTLQPPNKTPSWSGADLLEPDLREEMSGKMAAWHAPKVDESFLNDQHKAEPSLKDSYLG